MEVHHGIATISKQALQRLPYYLDYLTQLEQKEVEYVSAPIIAKALDLSDVQVRKDLAAVCETPGIPKKGFLVKDLIKGLKNFLGYNDTSQAVLVGAGQLGRALLSYKEFESYGIHIVAAFDQDQDLIGTTVNGKEIFDVSKLKDLCLRLNIKIAIVTVPADAAQNICDQLMESGVKAIWNFAPVYIKVPEDILVHNEDMSSSYALLVNHLRNTIGS